MWIDHLEADGDVNQGTGLTCPSCTNVDYYGNGCSYSMIDMTTVKDSGGHGGWPITSAETPTETILVGEGQPRWEIYIWPNYGYAQGAIVNVHGDRANFCFIDGHVDAAKLSADTAKYCMGVMLPCAKAWRINSSIDMSGALSGQY